MDWKNRLVGTVGAVATAASSLAVFGAAAVPVAASDVSDAELSTMAYVATHSWAAAQPTTYGRRLVDLALKDGRVWAGYGDYNSNTGPVVVAGIDPDHDSAFVSDFTMDTEAAYNLRSIGGELVIPATDPRVNADFATSEPWEQSRPINATHVYDSVTLTGSDRWLVGSQGQDAVAWRSQNGGASWTESIRVKPFDAVDGSYARFYFAAVLGDELWVQAKSSSGAVAPSAKVFDGSSWRDDTPVLRRGTFGWKPMPYEQGVVFHRVGHGYVGEIFYFDGQTTTAIARGFDHEVVDGTLFVLDEARIVRRRLATGDWTSVAQAPANAISIAIDDDTVYSGTDNSELYSFRPEPSLIGGEGAPTTTAPPTTTLPSEDTDIGVVVDEAEVVPTTDDIGPLPTTGLRNQQWRNASPSAQNASPSSRHNRDRSDASIGAGGKEK